MHSDLAVNMRSFISSPQAAAAAFTGPVIEASSSSSSSDTISPSSAAAALSTSTLSSPISVSEEGIAGQKKKKEIILIGGSLGKRTMIKKHLQNVRRHHVRSVPDDLLLTSISPMCKKSGSRHMISIETPES